MLPYSVKKNFKVPIGTAFTLDGQVFYSACHVFNVKRPSKFIRYLRDKKGTMYELDTIIKFSSRKDYIVFTLKKPIPGVIQYSNVSAKNDIQDEVIAVGNTYGEGIISRDGLFTSVTPEQLNGEWDWLRFSAAASPGNSGGPLINKNGNIMGIVIGGPKSENFNVALPMEEIGSVEETEGTISMYEKYYVPFVSKYIFLSNTITLTLPEKYPDVLSSVVSKLGAVYDETYENYLDKYEDAIFLTSENKNDGLYQKSFGTFMSFPYKRKDETWALYFPKYSELKFGDERIIHYKKHYGIYFFAMYEDDISIDIRTPDDADEISEVYLKLAGIKRQVGKESIKVTSLGKTAIHKVYTDTFKRNWYVFVWRLDFKNMELIMYATKTPSGFNAFADLKRSGDFELFYENDLNFVANQLQFGYAGKVSQWETFLSDKENSPSFFNTFKIQLDEDLKIENSKYSIMFNDDVFPLSEESILYMGCRYDVPDNIHQLYVSDVYLYEDTSFKSYMSLSHYVRPAADCRDSIQETADSVFSRAPPYTGRIRGAKGYLKTIFIPDFYTDLEKRNDCYYLKISRKIKTGKETARENIKKAKRNIVKNFKVFNIPKSMSQNEITDKISFDFYNNKILGSSLGGRVKNIPDNIIKTLNKKKLPEKMSKKIDCDQGYKNNDVAVYVKGDVIKRVALLSEDMETIKGLSPGDAENAVVKMYGKPIRVISKKNTRYFYTLKDRELVVYVRDKRVMKITAVYTGK
jgi:hypothetical protein